MRTRSIPTSFISEKRSHVQDADDVLERAPIDRVARVGGVDNGGQALGGRQLDRERDHLRPRHHHVRGLLVGEVEDLVEHLGLLALDLTVLARSLEQHPQFGLGKRLFGLERLHAEQAKGQVRGALKHPDQRHEHDEEEPHGRRDS